MSNAPLNPIEMACEAGLRGFRGGVRSSGGGDRGHIASFAHSAYRNLYTPTNADFHNGFRFARGCL
jgi:hypothetical protein